MEQLYMIELELLNVLTKDFSNKIKTQKEIVDNLISSGIIKSYTLALDYSKIWIIATANSEFEVMTLIAKFPLSQLMIPSINLLASHETKIKRKETLLLN